MKYLVCGEDGQLDQRSAPSYDVALRDVGPEGWDRVRLHNAAALFGPEQDAAAFCNDCGLVMPETYSRNVVGTCLLASLGANVQPYAGPIVLTGWDAMSSGPEVRALTDEQIAVIRRIHGGIGVALGLAPDTSKPSAARRRWWAAMRDVAEVARSGPVQGITMLHDDDALAFLQQLRGGDRHA